MPALVYKGGTVALTTITDASGTAVSGTYTYGDGIQSVTVDPTTNVQTFTGISGKTLVDNAPSTYAFTITFTQREVDSQEKPLTELLYDYEGGTAQLAYKTETGGKTYTATVRLQPAQVGGDGVSALTSSVTLPCLAKPVRS